VVLATVVFPIGKFLVCLETLLLVISCHPYIIRIWMDHSIAIEFDTYESGDTCNDPNGNHISIHTEGTAPNTSHHRASLGYTTTIPVLNQGVCLNCRILYSDSSLIVQLKDSTLESLFKTILRIPINIQKTLHFEDAPTVWMGFTASTGALHQKHEILDFFIYRLS
jgi:hypothetical protein